MALTKRKRPRREAAETPARLRVVVVGLRGVVGVQGGIETHARRLYPLLARLGCAVEIVQRSPYFERRRRPRDWHGIRLAYLWCPRLGSLETAVHTLLGVVYAAFRRPDILHLHAVGPGLLAPLARLLGLRVVLTYHAPDYEREKFGTLEKGLLRAGERMGLRFSNAAIAVSKPLCAALQARYRAAVVCIPNGTPPAVRTSSRAALERFDLEPGRYVLCVGRLDPVKRHLDVIDAFERASPPRWRLAIVGEATGSDAYSETIRERARRNPAIVLTGFQQGLALRELYSHAAVFVLASALEGHPIALLEAMSYGVPSAVSAIPANLAMPLPRGAYFPEGDVGALAARLRAAAAGTLAEPSAWRDLPAIVRRDFSWRFAARATRSTYDELVLPRLAQRSEPRAPSYPR